MKPSLTHCRMFPNQFAAHYIAENNIITKDLLLFSKLMRLIRWTRTNDQSPTDIRALHFKHIGQAISLVVYGQTSTYRRFDSAYRRRPFLSLHHLEHT